MWGRGVGKNGGQRLDDEPGRDRVELQLEKHESRPGVDQWMVGMDALDHESRLGVGQWMVGKDALDLRVELQKAM